MSTLLVRADASPDIGTGHVIRCFALAQAWKELAPEAKVVFLTADTVPIIESRLLEEGIVIERLSTAPGGSADMSNTGRLALAHEAKWIVLDGYLFNAEFQRLLKLQGFKVLFADDYGHAAHYYCDLILNQNINAQRDWYASREPYTKMLLGSRYALLRSEFALWLSWVREISPVGRRILITMGGSDPAEATERVLDAVALLEDAGLEIKLVIGAANLRRHALLKRIQTLHSQVDVIWATSEMSELMAWADIAISAAGSTLWELLFMQLPTITVSIATNQLPAARYLSRVGVTISFELDLLTPIDLARSLQHLIGSERTRAEMASLGRKFVDGEGASRVVHTMLADQGLLLRQANVGDCRLLWEWVNEAEVRRTSFHQEAISWETHVDWLNTKLKDQSTALFIAEQDGVPVGQIRYEVNGIDAVVSVSLDQQMRGKGFGSGLIALGSERIFLNPKIETIHAYIRPENRGSVRAFLNAGFEESRSSQNRGIEAIHCIQTRKVTDAGKH